MDEFSYLTGPLDCGSMPALQSGVSSEPAVGPRGLRGPAGDLSGEPIDYMVRDETPFYRLR